MVNIVKQADSGPWEPALPTNRGLYYGGAWHEPVTGSYAPTFDPGRGTTLCDVAESTAEDIDKAVEAARAGFLVPAAACRAKRESRRWSAHGF
jgi:betaine-aldehyde dehydrogenase